MEGNLVPLAVQFTKRTKNWGFETASIDCFEPKPASFDFSMNVRNQDAVLALNCADQSGRAAICGFLTVKAAVAALYGEEVPGLIDTGFYYYDASNIDDPKISAVLHD